MQGLRSLRESAQDPEQVMEAAAAEDKAAAAAAAGSADKQPIAANGKGRGKGGSSGRGRRRGVDIAAAASPDLTARAAAGPGAGMEAAEGGAGTGTGRGGEDNLLEAELLAAKAVAVAEPLAASAAAAAAAAAGSADEAYTAGMTAGVAAGIYAGAAEAGAAAAGSEAGEGQGAADINKGAGREVGDGILGAAARVSKPHAGATNLSVLACTGWYKSKLRARTGAQKALRGLQEAARNPAGSQVKAAAKWLAASQNQQQQQQRTLPMCDTANVVSAQRHQGARVASLPPLGVLAGQQRQATEPARAAAAAAGAAAVTAQQRQAQQWRVLTALPGSRGKSPGTSGAATAAGVGIGPEEESTRVP